MKVGDNAIYYSFRENAEVEVTIEEIYYGPLNSKMAKVRRVGDNQLRDIPYFRLSLKGSDDESSERND